jgi:hypothetical protein
MFALAIHAAIMRSLFEAVKAAVGARRARIVARPAKIKATPIKFAPPPKPTPRRSLYEIIKGIVGVRPKPKPQAAPPTAPPRPAAPPAVPPRQKPAAPPALVDPRLVDDFLYAGMVIYTINSSNVQAMQYDADHRLLYIWFNGGGYRNRRYTYSGVHEAMAKRFYLAASRAHGYGKKSAVLVIHIWIRL